MGAFRASRAFSGSRKATAETVTQPRRPARALVAVGVALAVGLGANAAATPAAADRSDYKLNRVTLSDGSKLQVRWDPCQKRITYRVNADALPKAQRSSARADTKRAMKKLAAATGMTFDYTGRTAQVPRDTARKSWWERQKKAEIVISWVRQDRASKTNLLGAGGSGWAAGTGGYSFKMWTIDGKSAGAAGRGFVVLDAKQDRKLRPGFGKGSTRGALLLHELGHVVGLEHVGSTGQLMYPTVLSRSDTNYNTGDLRGLHKVGQAAGCIKGASMVWNQI